MTVKEKITALRQKFEALMVKNNTLDDKTKLPPSETLVDPDLEQMLKD